MSALDPTRISPESRVPGWQVALEIARRGPASTREQADRVAQALGWMFEGTGFFHFSYPGRPCTSRLPKKFCTTFLTCAFGDGNATL
jgi:hypothetical protein